MTITLNGTTGITTPDVTSDGLTVDSTTLVVDEANNQVGIGTTSHYDASTKLTVDGRMNVSNGTVTGSMNYGGGTLLNVGTLSNHNLQLMTNNTTRAIIDTSGNFMVGTTNTAPSTNNVEGHAIGLTAEFSRAGSNPVDINRVNDGSLIIFRGQGVSEGSISVSGTTVSYNGGHLARWAQTTTAKDESLVKGTVLSNLDEMNGYVDAEGNAIENEQLNKVKVSDVEGDANVAGVFVSWDFDEAHSVDEINMAMTGDMIIRIAQGTTVQRGDLLMSAGDGTAKPQGDDIVRSKTIAKVTSTNVTCTYTDGSYCVPCVLMAC